ncbi:MAG TPA: glycosyltransferase family 87 protein [Tepidisphaeraceae bacterium]|jgi:hypothetical protein
MRKRLWQAAVLLTIVTLVFAGANLFLPKDKSLNRHMLGHDFIAFYTAGTFVRQGRAGDLYDLPQIADHQTEIVAAAGLDTRIEFDRQRFGPYWNPPFYAWLFVPLSLLPFNQALAAWMLLNLAALGGATWMLMRMLAPRGADLDTSGRAVDWKTIGLVPLLIFLSMPFVQAMSHGQNTPISLCILCGVVTFWRNKRAVLAGGLCALLAYKPQLAAVVAGVLVLSLGWRALTGLCFAGSGIVLVTQLTMPGAIVDYLHRLPANVRWMQVEHAYMWERHATLKGFWRLLVQGREAGDLSATSLAVIGGSMTIVAALLLRAVVRQWRCPQEDAWSQVTARAWRDRLIAATVCAAPLLMPFYFDYDLLLLAIPAVLMAAEEIHRPVGTQRAASTRWLGRAWIAMYVCMILNPGLAAGTRVNLNVLGLAIVAVLMTLRATPRRAPMAAETPVAIAVTVSRRAA